ncbi:hypothetical protein LCGC14_0388280 [marine sediment metagenome]|uniref:Uncharacterized protein n=1 Tax=marine sediment metagenome TaxID=412755 RepID=A0A0F9VMA8_9ZZZZ
MKNNEAVEWWKELEASKRFELMREYDIQNLTDKAIRRIHRNEHKPL